MYSEPKSHTNPDQLAPIKGRTSPNAATSSSRVSGFSARISLNSWRQKDEKTPGPEKVLLPQTEGNSRKKGLSGCSAVSYMLSIAFKKTMKS